MTNRMDTETLRALAGEATPGPWQLCAHLGLPDENGCTCGYRGVIFGREHYAICQPGHDVTLGEEGLDPPRLPRAEEIANSRLIAQTPALAAEVLEHRAGQTYRYIGKDGRPVLARDLEDERDQLRARIVDLELLLARNLVMDLGSGEEGADALGGIHRAIALVMTYREANPLPDNGGNDAIAF